MSTIVKESFKSWKSWKNFDIETKKFFVNGKDTGLQAIYRKGRFVKMLSQSYEVVPNENVLAITDKIAGKISMDGQHAKPFKMDKHKWFKSQADHMITNPEGTQACAMYMFPKIYKVGDKDIQIGFVARNSIDGKWAFSASVLSYRTFCANMMMHISRSSFLGIGTPKMAGVKNSQKLEDMKTLSVQALSSVSKRHTKSLTDNDLESVKVSMESVIKCGVQTIEKYRDLTKLKVNQQIANAIMKRMPKTVTKEIEWLEVGKDKKIKFDEKTTQWKAFNDLTENLTHKSTNFRKTMLCMKNTDAIFGTGV